MSMTFFIVFPNLSQFISKRTQIHRRTGRGGGDEGGCSPPKFWATQIFWAARENLGKASFQRRFHVFLLV